MSQICCVIVLCLCASAAASFAASRGSLRNGGHSNHTVDMTEVELSLQASSRAVLAGGQDKLANRFASVESSMWQTFQALPKNSWGRLAPRAVRYAVHNYFAKEHGWLIEGLAPHGNQANVSEVHEASILQDKAPALVEALLEVRQNDHGLSLSNVVTMVVVLEQLIFDESVKLLEHSYQLNSHSTTEKVEEHALHDILQSYLLLFGLDVNEDVSEVLQHQALKAELKSSGIGGWSDVVTFERDAVWNFEFARKHQTNPFAQHRYSFEVASQIVDQMAQDYGKWQNSECRKMKEVLMDLDPVGAGRIPLSTFYSQPEEATYQFTESVEYLRKTGALDETVQGSPHVLIANYLLGPSNCVASSTYYSICCLSECEVIMNELEGKVQAPTASPERLLGLVGNISSSSVDAPRQFTRDMIGKLHDIAQHHEDAVPLHGRLFSQWLHYAFPNECPFPQIVESSIDLTPNAWLDDKSMASEEEKQQHIEASFAQSGNMGDFSMAQWTEHEVLIAHELPVARRSTLRCILGTGMQIAALLAAVRPGLAVWRSASRAFYGVSFQEKQESYLLPVHHHTF